MNFQWLGKTALITGASSGIGESYARTLAALGTHLVLVARSADKLHRLAEELATRQSVKVAVLPEDLARPGAAQRLLDACAKRGLQIDALVNNAGFGTYGAFETIAPERDQQLIQLNVAAVCDLAHAFLPAMLARGSGVILNIASTAGFQPAPLFAVYAASKAFVLSFSEALWAEYRGRGVRVLAVCPGPTATGFFDASQSNIGNVAFFSRQLSSDQVVQQSLRALDQRRSYIIIGWLNYLIAHSSRLAPRALVAGLGALVMRPTEE